MASEIEQLRTELAALREQVSMLAAELETERKVGALTRKKVGHCRGCQDKPDVALGHPALTPLEKLFCEQGHRFVLLSPDQFRALRTW